MDVIVEGITTEPNFVATNICCPITVRPEVRVTWVRDEQAKNKEKPKNKKLLI